MWYREGTITFTQGSNTLVGAGTAWNVTANGVLPGMIVIGPDNKLYEIKRVTSDTNIVLSEPYTGETQSEVPCRIITTYEGDLTQFSARFTALMSRMSADSKSIRSWLTALDEVTIEREDGTEVTVKPLMQIVNEHNENVEWYKNNTDAIDAAGDKAREAAASAAAAAKSANAAGEKASQASQSASAAASSQSAASASATAAKKSETNAESAYLAAGKSAESALSSATTATAKATEATNQATAAKNSASAAKSSETNAKASEDNAASSKEAAAESASSRLHQPPRRLLQRMRRPSRHQLRRVVLQRHPRKQQRRQAVRRLHLRAKLLLNPLRPVQKLPLIVLKRLPAQLRWKTQVLQLKVL
ncbi:hypothetical protein [Escherichia coli]|uniref:hypothetical protein n=1 Tax=Escherichia coli TaxID=562 RepID=UPI003465C134